MIDIAALDAHVRALVAVAIVRPQFVSQRSVEAIFSIPRREYLRLSRERAWPTHRERRLVIARTEDVARYFDSRIAAHGTKSAVGESNSETIALARVGARRVA